MSWYNPMSWGEEESGGSNSDAQKYLQQSLDSTHQYLDPYAELGLRTMPTLEQQYSQLIYNPAAMQQMLGSGYTQSPGYQYNLDEQTNALNQSLAAGGMLGTPTAQSQMMGVASGNASQDYWKYYGANADLYNTGLEGTHKMFNTGFQGTQDLVSSLNSIYGSQANLAYSGQQSEDEMFASLLGAGIGVAAKGFI